MGYKDIFIDFSSMTQEEIKEYQAKMGVQKSKSKDNNHIAYKKSFTVQDRVHWFEGIKDNRFAEYQTTNCSLITNQLAWDESVSTYETALRLLKKINLLRFLGIENRVGTNFACPIIEGNIASVNYNGDGDWSYFTRNRENTNGHVFGIVDLTQIIYNIGYYEALNKLCKIFIIDVKERTWIENQKKKYAGNIAFIQNAVNGMAHEYPSLYKYIKRHLYLLEEMNNIGKNNVGLRKEAVDDESIFFNSTRFISEMLAERGIGKHFTTVNRILNMFSALGLVEKVRTEHVPQPLIDKAKEQLTNQDYHFTVTFYCIPAMNRDVLIRAEKRAIKLKNARIKATGVTVDNLSDVLGYTVFLSVFGDTKDMTKAIRYKKGKRKDDDFTSDGDSEIRDADAQVL